MKMKRLLAIFALIAVLCTFCTVGVFADEAGEATATDAAVDASVSEVVEEPALNAEPPAKPEGGDPAGEPPAGDPPAGEPAEPAPATGDISATIEVEVADGKGVVTLHTCDATPIKTVAATCTKDGYALFKCTETECAAENMVHTVTIPAKGHVWSTVAKTWGDATEDAPTCMSGGTGYIYCLVCGEKGEARDLSAVDHTFYDADADEWNIVVDQDDCLGYKYHFECIYGCGTKATYETDVKKGTKYELKTIDATGTEQTFEVTPAKNVKAGDVIYVEEEARWFDEDGKAVEAGTEGAAMKHSWGDWTQDVAPTCQAEGTEYRVCDVCSQYQTRAVDKVDHTWAVETTHLDSCTQLTVTYYCTTCSRNGAADPEYTDPCSLDKNAHNSRIAHKTEILTGDFHQWEYDPDTDTATCEQDGTIKRTCKYCDETETVASPAKGHAFGAWQKAINGARYEDGVLTGYVYFRTCERCGKNEQKYFDKSVDPNEVDPAPVDPEPVDPAEDVKLALSVAGLNVAADGVDGAANVVEVSGKRDTDLYAVVYTTWENASGDTIMVGGSPIKVGEDGSAPLLAIQPNSAYNKMTNAYVVILDDQGVAKTRVFGSSLILDRLIQVTE